jgi:hypothetical protein
MLRGFLALVVAMLAGAAGRTPPTVVDGWGQRTAAYDGEFTFVRVRWRSGLDGLRRPGSSNNFWLRISARGAELHERAARSHAPHLFRFPIAVLWEPGY